jgi:hypothetical protein
VLLNTPSLFCVTLAFADCMKHFCIIVRRVGLLFVGQEHLEQFRDACLEMAEVFVTPPVDMVTISEGKFSGFDDSCCENDGRTVGFYSVQ